MRRRIVIALVLVSIVTEAAAGGRRRAVRTPGGSVPAPSAAADAYSVSPGSTLAVPAPGVLANDTANGGSIVSYGPVTGSESTALGATVQTASGGSVRLLGDGSFTYTPPGAFSGTDTFKYTLRNGGGSSTAPVTVDVRGAVPVAATDAYSTPPEITLYVPAPGVLTNDSLAGARIASFGPRSGEEQATLGATAATAQGGLVSLNADGSFTYTPPPSVDDGYGYQRPYLGLDGFSYVIRSGASSSTGAVNVAVEIGSGNADFVVTTPGHYYAISGQTGENPVLVLTRGKTYTFQISASGSHPFAILDAPAGSLTNNNITQGVLTFAVPMTAQNYRYRCTTHGFGNVINTVP